MSLEENIRANMKAIANRLALPHSMVTAVDVATMQYISQQLHLSLGDEWPGNILSGFATTTLLANDEATSNASLTYEVIQTQLRALLQLRDVYAERNIALPSLFSQKLQILEYNCSKFEELL